MSVKSRFKRTLKVLLKKEINSQRNGRNDNFLEILLEKLGNKLSFETQSSINKKGEPLPWFTYPAIEYLNQLNLKEYNVLEWGCGNSTKYFSARTNSITSIESNPEWFKKIKNIEEVNSEIYLKETKEEYTRFPTTLTKKFDIIIIDGIYRDECVNTAIGLHNKKCFIILDNADRYPDLCKILRDSNYLEIDFHGFGPINNYTWTTSFFYPNEGMTKLIPLQNQPLIPTGGGY